MGNCGRKLEELQQCVAGETPSLGVPHREGVGVSQGFGEGYHSRLAVQGSREFLGVLQDNLEVDGGEEARRDLAYERMWRTRCNSPLLHLLRLLHDEIGTVALVIVGGHAVVEPDKADRQILCLGVLQTLQNNLHDHDEILLQRGTNRSH